MRFIKRRTERSAEAGSTITFIVALVALLTLAARVSGQASPAPTDASTLAKDSQDPRKTTGPFVLGALASQTWTVHTYPGGQTYGGRPTYPDGVRINQFSTQAFVNFNRAHGWAIASAPILIANRDAADDDKWTIPLGLGVTNVTEIGKQPMSLGIQDYEDVVRPASSGSSQLIASFLFPKPESKQPKEVAP